MAAFAVAAAVLADMAAAAASFHRSVQAAHMTDRDSAAVFVRACATAVCADRTRLGYAVMNSCDPSVPIIVLLNRGTACAIPRICIRVIIS